MPAFILPWFLPMNEAYIEAALEVIDGDAEARLVFRAVQHDFAKASDELVAAKLSLAQILNGSGNYQGALDLLTAGARAHG
mgnify:CR=1 FL=1